MAVASQKMTLQGGGGGEEGVAAIASVGRSQVPGRRSALVAQHPPQRQCREPNSSPPLHGTRSSVVCFIATPGRCLMRCAHLIKFLLRILGALMAAPTMEEPVMKMPLQAEGRRRQAAGTRAWTGGRGRKGEVTRRQTVAIIEKWHRGRGNMGCGNRQQVAAGGRGRLASRRGRRNARTCCGGAAVARVSLRAPFCGQRLPLRPIWQVTTEPCPLTSAPRQLNRKRLSRPQSGPQRQMYSRRCLISGALARSFSGTPSEQIPVPVWGRFTAAPADVPSYKFDQAARTTV